MAATPHRRSSRRSGRALALALAGCVLLAAVPGIAAPPAGTQGAALRLPLSAEERDALGRVAYAEAGNQGPVGLLAVICTVLNRVAAGRFQDSVTAVIDAPGQFEPVARAGGWRRLPPLSAAEAAAIDRLLAGLADGALGDPTGGALYFQNRSIVAARAAAGLVPASLVDFGGRTPIARIGDHHFYRDGPAGAGGLRLVTIAGWGIVLGAYPEDFRALRAVALARAGLGLPDEVGKARAVPLKDPRFYAALLVGLAEDQADRSCQALRRAGAFCVKLGPDRLDDPDAAWPG
ncbi:MAG: cell wall hydrolase [Dongiaceae bacterium]